MSPSPKVDHLPAPAALTLAVCCLFYAQNHGRFGKMSIVITRFHEKNEDFGQDGQARCAQKYTVKLHMERFRSNSNFKIIL